MPANPTLLFDQAGLLLACARDSLTDAGFDAPQSAVIVNGVAAQDNCCDRLSVRLVRSYPSEVPPAAFTGENPCFSSLLVAEWEVRYDICVLAEPDDADLLESAAELYSYLWVLQTGLGCCLKSKAWRDQDSRSGRVMGGRIDGPFGACAAAVVPLWTALGPWCDCHDPLPLPPPLV